MAKTDKKATDELNSHNMTVKVFSPYQTYYEGPAQSLSAKNDTGPFDILPKHHNFMTLVNEGEITIRVEGAEDKRLRISKGVLHARRNKVTVFLDV
jgi:F0F1-type ATP synthase epsilon subunit